MNMVTIVLLSPSGNSTPCSVPRDIHFSSVEELFSHLNNTAVTNKDIFAYQHFRHLQQTPETTSRRQLVYYLNGSRLKNGERLYLQEENLLEIKHAAHLTSTEIPHLNKRYVQDYQDCRQTMNVLLSKVFNFTDFPIDGADDFDDLRRLFPRLPTQQKLRILYRFAQILYKAPFENYSKLLCGINFTSPLQMWRNIFQGHGGICAEKTAAYKFICDLLGVVNRAVFGSPIPIKDDIEQCLLKCFQSGGQQPLPFWLQHHMLEITVDGEKILIDVTNGNLPLLFLDEKDSHLRYRSGLKCRMVYQTDKLHLYPSTEIAGDLMLTISEYMSQCQTFKYIFSQQLGLLISDEFYVTAFADWHEQRSRSMQQYYSRLAQKSALPFPIFFHRDNCNAIEDEWMSQLMQKSLHALYENYPLQEYRGGFTIVLQKLIPRRKIRLSSSLRHKIFTPDNIGVPS